MARKRFSPWTGVVTVLSLALESDSSSAWTGDASRNCQTQKVGGMLTSMSDDARIPLRSRFVFLGKGIVINEALGASCASILLGHAT